MTRKHFKPLIQVQSNVTAGEVSQVMVEVVKSVLRTRIITTYTSRVILASQDMQKKNLELS